MRFTRGDTFEFSGPVTITVNRVVLTDATGYSFRSQVRDGANALLSELTCSFLSYDPPVVHVIADESTNSWTLGPARIDLQFLTPAGKIVSTKRVSFIVEEDVTWEP